MPSPPTPPSTPRPTSLRLGTRSSQLALVQAHGIANRLEAAGHRVEIVHIRTKGDQSTQPLSQAGGIGLFTKAIQQALLDQEIDFAVHSLKDLPTESIPGLTLAAVPERELVNDVIVTESGSALDQIPHGARIGTGSVRRRAQLLSQRSDLQVLDIRGNVDTRLEKLAVGDFEAIILAAAGLKRLGKIDDRCWHVPLKLMLPAVGQGALGIEARIDDAETIGSLSALNDPAARAAVTAERSLLQALTAGCLAPVGALGISSHDELQLSAAVFSQDGTQKIAAERAGRPDQAQSLGHELAEELLSRGAGPLIQAAR